MRWYPPLLRLFPRPFRERFGADMSDLFNDRWQTARRQSTAALLILIARTIADLCVHAAAERRSHWLARRNPQSTRKGSVMDQCLQDVRFAARSFIRRPGFTAVALITIALGVAANTAIFSVVRPLLLEAPPFPNADRIVRIYEVSVKRPNANSVASPANFDAWEQKTDLFESIAGFSGASATLTGVGDAERLQLATVSTGYFDVFGVRPALGRTFSSEEIAANAKVIVLSDRLWRRRFGADPTVVERSVSLDGSQWQIVGVMPPGFMEANRAGWVPLPLPPALRANRNTRFLSVVGRLRPGVTAEFANAGTNASVAALAAAFPKFNQGVASRVVGWQEDSASSVRDGLWMLQGVAMIVLFIAGANLANLVMAQAAGRTKEFSVRMALGAGRRRLMRQLVTEGVVLASIGGLAGTVLAIWAVPAISALAPSWLPRADSLSVGVWDLVAGMSLAVLTGASFSLLPALMVTRTSAMAGGASARGTTASRPQQRTRSILVAVQVALALVLLTGAGLLIRSFDRLTAQPIGFAPDHVLTAELSLPPLSYDTDEKRRRLFSTLLESVAARPGVVSAAASTALPFTWWEWMDEFAVLGRTDVTRVGGAYRMVTPGYFETMRVPIVRGRTFQETDVFGAPQVAVVNEQFVREHAALGDVFALTLARGAGDTSPIAIVGVVGDTRHRSFERPAQAELYLPLSQWAPRSVTLAVRTIGDPAQVAPALRESLRDLDPNLPLAEVKPLDAWVAAAVAERRFYMVLLAIFSGVAAVLAVVGIYGVMSYVVRLRTREIGIRVALGATATGVERLVVRQGMMPVLVGAAAGGIVAAFATALLRDQLFQIEARDPATLAGVAAGLLLVGAAACWIPSRRTSRVDPAKVLQSDGA